VPDAKPVHKSKLWVPVKGLGMTKSQQSIFKELVGARYNANKDEVAFVSRENYDVEANEVRVFQFLKNALGETMQLDQQFVENPPSDTVPDDKDTFHDVERTRARRKAAAAPSGRK
jgi:hypothetical protein